MRRFRKKEDKTMKKSFIISAVALSLCSTQAWGQKLGELLHNFTYQARIGYNLGGTAPIGMPATIRTLHSYSLQPNLLLGIDAHYPLDNKWGLMFGLHFEGKGMKTDAGVKNYHMTMVKGGEQLEGMFTGNVITKVDQSLATIPVQATYDVTEKLRLKLGPYFSYVTAHKFEGNAYDGYLRQGDPTGPKVELAMRMESVANTTSRAICATGSLASMWVPTGISRSAGEPMWALPGAYQRYSRKTST